MSFLARSSVIVLCVTLIACSDDSSDSADNTDTTGNTLAFEPCDDNPALDCGVFDVPLIHDSTDNRRISIDVARLPGMGDGPHEILLVNSGGPGSGTEVLREMADANELPTSIRERYDIIGFDQRGVGEPLRVDCDALGNAEPSLYPRNQSEVMSFVDDSTLLAEACSDEYADQLQWLGSNAVVRDMEVMRTLLDTPALNILGSSFGTRISALYLERYPDASGRIVLDAPLRPGAKIDALLVDTAVAQQRSFEQILNACGTTLPDCDRTTIEAAFAARADSLLDSEDQITFEAFLTLLNIAIDESDSGELLAPLLIDYAISGNPAEMFELTEQFGLDESDDENESITLERAVVCADDDARPTAESLIATLGRLNEASDVFAESLIPIAASCVAWPEALDPVAAIQTTDAPAALVIGGSGDIFTPNSWAVETAEAIGGVLLSSDHQGHTTVFNRGNDCVDSIVVEFLLDGTLPPAATGCH